MFGRVLIAQLKLSLRSKIYVFWTLAFPMILGTLFYFAFSSVYENNRSEPIPVVIEAEISLENHPFIKVLDDLEYEDGTRMIEKVDVSDHEEAEKLLGDGDIAGIITVSGLKDIYLEVNGMGVKHSILSGIISEYRAEVDKAVNEKSERPDEMMGEPSNSLSFVHEKSLGGENRDPFVTYFYNLIAMLAMMASIAALYTIVSNQANQSATGIRLDGSSVNKVFLELAQLAALMIIQSVITAIALSYYIYVLGVKYGGDTGLVYVTSISANLVGLSLGYLVAHIGKFSRDKKEALLMAILLGGGFMAGLMLGDIKIWVEMNFPLFNRINPSAVITDAFYALNLYGVGPRYYRALIYIFGLSAVMTIAGLFLSRKNSYKSL